MSFLKIYMRALGILFREERVVTTGLMAFCVLVGVIQVVEPVFFGRVIDSLAVHSKVLTLLVAWAGIGLLNVVVSVALAVMSDRLAHRQRLNALDDVFERAISLPVSYHTSEGSGKVVHAILSGTDRLFDLWLSFLREHLASFISVCFLVPLALTMDLRMAGLLFALAVVYLIANSFIARNTFARQEQVQVLQQNVFGRLGDVIGNVTVVQSYTRLIDEIKGLQRMTAQLLSAQYPILTWWGILSVVTRISSTLTMVSLLSLGSWLVAKGELTVGEVVSFVGFSTLLIGKLEQISGFASRIITQAPALRHFFELLDKQSDAVDLPNARVMEGNRGHVSFENVTYQYKNSPLGVFDLNFEAKPGQLVALVGRSGSGKTTTLALLQRLFDPQTGVIRIDGEDIREFTLSSLRHSIATVFQDAGLFNRSIAENIRVGRPGASDLEVQIAAQQADADEFIKSKPGGYEFIIGERGSALSGGERQRIAIARAILKNSPILVFDEATSALDNETERRIQIAVSNLQSQNKTTFVIAHRLSTVISADLILVFEAGRIVEAGSFEELKRQHGFFANLVKLGELNQQKPAPGGTLDAH